MYKTAIGCGRHKSKRRLKLTDSGSQTARCDNLCHTAEDVIILESLHNIFLALQSWKLGSVVEPRSDKSVPGALTCHRGSSGRHLLHHAFRRLRVDRERRRLIRSDFDAGDLSLRHGAREDRLPHWLILPRDQVETV